MYVRTDRCLIPALAPSRRGVVIDIVAPRAREGGRARPALNLAIVLDRSGSMGGGKFDLAREAAGRVLAHLTPADRFALVVYDDRVDVVVESTPATTEAVANARRRLAEVGPRGSTDLCGGWLAGCGEVAGHMAPEALGRCLLLTDGLANHGITNHGEIARHAGELARRGVVTSTFGVGRGFDEDLLQAMAREGAGHDYYIEDAVQIPDTLASELGEALEVVARDVRLDIEGPEACQLELVSLFKSRCAGRMLSCGLGDLISKQELRLIAMVSFPPGDLGEELSFSFAIHDFEGRMTRESGRLTFRRVEEREDAAQPRDLTVARLLAGAEAEVAIREGLALNRHGEFDAAAGLLRAAADRIGERLPGDPVAEELMADLHARARELGGRLDSPSSKALSYRTSHRLRSREPDGKTSRRS